MLYLLFSNHYLIRRNICRNTLVFFDIYFTNWIHRLRSAILVNFICHYSRITAFFNFFCNIHRPRRLAALKSMHLRAFALALQAGLRCKILFYALPLAQLCRGFIRILPGGFQRLEFPLPATDLPFDGALPLRAS